MLKKKLGALDWAGPFTAAGLFFTKFGSDIILSSITGFNEEIDYGLLIVW